MDRGVAQLASVLHSGCRGRRFESGHPDQTFFQRSRVLFYGAGIVSFLADDAPKGLSRTLRRNSAYPALTDSRLALYGCAVARPSLPHRQFARPYLQTRAIFAMITATEIRERYVRFFLERGHRRVPSAPLVPPTDPTLLFTTAGMVQFKPYYTGEIEPPFPTAVTVQKCLRAGGKGCDLENVGRTLRHHTFFEMLGNFSFGDYFKKEAITWGWEFCTGEQGLALPPERIWATVYGKKDPSGQWQVDDEAEALWKSETGLINPIIRLDESENFWGPAGGTGACGPCSEIKFFMGTDEELREYQKLAAGSMDNGGEGIAKIVHDIVEEGDLFLEIWNLVFPQFDHQPDGSRPTLKYRGIDTGAGLERMTTACQMIASGGKVWSPYETDLLEPIIAKVAGLAKLPYPRLRDDEATENRLREMGHDPASVRLAMNACADHARTLTFALAEGIVPSNEGRGYVIRRILRRAARFGKKIGIEKPFLWQLVDPVIEAMGEAWPEIVESRAQARIVIQKDEERFARTLNLGSEMLDGQLAELGEGGTLAGEDAFRLYDTYGFPLDLTEEVAEERGFDVDVEGYERCLEESKIVARASWKGGGETDLGQFIKDLSDAGRQTYFVRPDQNEKLEADAMVLAILRGEKRVDVLEQGLEGVIILNQTPFYGEGGGQVGDTGHFMLGKIDQVLVGGAQPFDVEDTQKNGEGFVFHRGTANEPIRVGQFVHAKVDAKRRSAIIKHHSATHLLQGALKQIVGRHVTQRGSHVSPDHLRFDFTNTQPISEATLREIEAVVNEQIQRDLEVITNVMAIEEAQATGAIAPFGEKYGATVRVVQMGNFSTEFCGGTHVARTGEIGSFVIVAESSVASGIRRIEAHTGPRAVATIAAERRLLAQLSRTLTVPAEQLPERIDTLQSELKSLRRELDQARSEKLAGQSGEMDVIEIGDARACIGWIEDADVKALREVIDRLKDKHSGGKFLAVLGSGTDGKATLIVGASQELAGSPLEAGKVVRELAPIFEGRGGGKPQFAQAGGKDAAALKAALQGDAVAERLRKLI